MGAVRVLALLPAAIPLTLWYAWVHSISFLNSVLDTLFCLSLAWALVSLLLCFRTWRKLGLSTRQVCTARFLKS